MSVHRPTKMSAQAARRLQEIRGDAPLRSPTVRVLANYAQHTDCNLATIGFTTGVDFDRLLSGTQYGMSFGQSPFAFRRGKAFEEQLRANGTYGPTLKLLREQLGFAVDDAKIVNLRDVHPKTRAGLILRYHDTRAQLKLVIQGAPTAPNLIDGAVLRTSIGGVDAYFEADALATRSTGPIQVAEVKSFPKVDERVDPEKLGAALDQVAIYILLARNTVDLLGGDPERLIADAALLITPRNVGMQPTVSVRNVGPRIGRVESLLKSIPNVGELAQEVPADLSFAPIADPKRDERERVDALHVLADRVGTSYKPGCLTSCGNARFCRERMYQDGLPCVLGASAARLLPGIPTLTRAEQLTRGAPASSLEAPAAEILGRAARLYDQAVGTPEPDVDANERRRA